MPKSKQAVDAPALDFHSYLDPSEPLMSRPRVDGIVLLTKSKSRKGHRAELAHDQGFALLKQAVPDLGTYVVGHNIHDIGLALPRSMPWSAYPATPAPVWRHRKERGVGMFSNYIVRSDTDVAHGLLLADAISTAQWVAYVRPDAAGPMERAYQAEMDYRFARWLELLPRDRADGLRLISCTPGEDAARDLGTLDRAIAELQRAGSSAARLDYQHTINATAVFEAIWQQACENAGLRNRPLPPILNTVFGLQLLYAVADRALPQWREGGDCLWKGTGRYAPLEISYFHDLCRGLTALKMEGVIRDVDFTDHRPLHSHAPQQLTSMGRAFLDLLHPDCRDPDVLLRWRDPAIGLIRPGSEQAIDAWTKRFFGRAKNKLDRLTAAAAVRKPASPPGAAAPEG